MPRLDLLKELRDSSSDELQKRLVRLERELALCCIRHTMKRVENPMQLRMYRREIARAKTILHQKQAETIKKGLVS